MISKQMLTDMERWTSLSHPHELSYDMKQPTKIPSSISPRENDVWSNASIKKGGNSNNSFVKLKPNISTSIKFDKFNGGNIQNIKKTKKKRPCFNISKKMLTRKFK